MNLQTELFRITDALEEDGADYALCGGIAVVVHGYPRLTRDIDILVRREDLDRVKRAVAPVGFTLESGILPFDVGQPQERHVFRLTKEEGSDHLILDLPLVGLVGPMLQGVWETRERHRVQDRDLHVVSRKGLGIMKRTAGRPKDLDDLKQLGLDPEVS